jgi:hypothetical protein
MLFLCPDACWARYKCHRPNAKNLNHPKVAQGPENIIISAVKLTGMFKWSLVLAPVGRIVHVAAPPSISFTVGGS